MTEPMPAPTPRHLLDTARGRVDEADARWLLSHALGQTTSWLYGHADDPLDPESVARFDALLRRRIAGEPVAYLCGRRGFWTLELQVGPETLIPRPETERLVELALERLPRDRPLQVADLGTGSGAIAMALASERPACRVFATDASADALGVARANAGRLRLANVEFRQGSWFGAVEELSFDLIASNPPYIAEGDPHLSRGDLRFEPPMALASGPDGLDAIRTIVSQAPAHLRPGGWLLLEHGHDQGPPVRALMAGSGFEAVATYHDLEARDRVTLGRTAF